MSKSADVAAPKCAAQIWGNWRYHPCGNKAALRHTDEQDYCRTHYPPNVDERKRKREEERDLRWAVSRERDRRNARIRAAGLRALDDTFWAPWSGSTVAEEIRAALLVVEVDE